MISSPFAWLYGAGKHEDVRHPYLALSSFSDSDVDRQLFFGRTRETEELFNRVLSSDLVLLFGRSGLGKTSLINAGLVGELRKQKYFPVVCQLTHSYYQSPAELVSSCMIEAAQRENVEVRKSGSGKSP